MWERAHKEQNKLKRTKQTQKNNAFIVLNLQFTVRPPTWNTNSHLTTSA